MSRPGLRDDVELRDGWDGRAAAAFLTYVKPEELLPLMLAQIEILRRADHDFDEEDLVGFVFGAAFACGYALAEWKASA